MKEGWELLTIKECCDILDYRRKPITKSKRESGTIPYYGATGLLDYVKDYIFDEPLVLLGEDGAKWGAGECSAYRIEGKSWVNNHAHALRPKRDIVNDYWLIYFLNYSNLQSYITGVTVPKLNQEKMCSITLPAPPLSEQQRIVDYLDAAFAKIDAMKANAEKSLNEAKALFQASLKEMLEPKEGWEEKKLGEVGTFIRGGNFSKKDFIEDGFPCVHYGQIHTKFGVATYNHLSCVPNNMVKKERCASKGDLIIAITSEDDEGSCKCTAWMADYEAYVGGHTAIFKHILNPLFVSYYFKASRFQKAKLEYTHGFKVVEISPKDIAKIPISYPPLSEQQTIVATLDSLKSKVDRLQSNFEKISQECDALKQAILRQVFE